jgi:hypothetical protein
MVLLRCLFLRVQSELLYAACRHPCARGNMQVLVIVCRCLSACANHAGASSRVCLGVRVTVAAWRGAVSRRCYQHERDYSRALWCGVRGACPLCCAVEGLKICTVAAAVQAHCKLVIDSCYAHAAPPLSVSLSVSLSVATGSPSSSIRT